MSPSSSRNLIFRVRKIGVCASKKVDDLADTQIVAFGHALLTGFDALRRALVVDERKRTDLDG